MVQPAYEQSRQKRLEENRKRLEELKLPQLSQALRQASAGPATPPMKPRKPRTVEKTMVKVRRSNRMANKPGPVYVEVSVDRADRVTIPRRVSKPRDLSNRVYASDEERAYSIEKAEAVQATLDATYPSFVKSMLPSHVSGGFWLGLFVSFCKRHLPKRDSEITLIDEDGEEYPTIYLPRKTGLSGGWKGFAVAHDLVDGDALVFHLIKPTTFKGKWVQDRHRERKAVKFLEVRHISSLPDPLRLYPELTHNNATDKDGLVEDAHEVQTMLSTHFGD